MIHLHYFQKIILILGIRVWQLSWGGCVDKYQTQLPQSQPPPSPLISISKSNWHQSSFTHSFKKFWISQVKWEQIPNLIYLFGNKDILLDLTIIQILLISFHAICLFQSRWSMPMFFRKDFLISYLAHWAMLRSMSVGYIFAVLVKFAIFCGC